MADQDDVKGLPLPMRRLLSGVIEMNPLYQDFADAMGEIDHVNVTAPRRYLQNVRNPDYTERYYLIANVKQLGFDYKSSATTDERYRRLMKMYSTYLPENGTYQFVNFLGYIKNTRFEPEQLWAKFERETPTYVGFRDGITVEPGERIWETTDGYYPTSHIRLYYDIEKWPIEDFSDVYPLFYQIAPIHLVLEAVIGKVKGDPAPVTMAAGGHETVEIAAICDMRPKSRARAPFGLAPAMTVVVEVAGSCDHTANVGVAGGWGILGGGHATTVAHGMLRIPAGALDTVPAV